MELIGRALREILLADPVVSSVVGSNVWHMRVPQGQDVEKYVRFAYKRIRPASTKSGQSEVDTQEVVIDVVGTNDYDVSVVAKAIRDRLDRLPHGIYDGKEFLGVEFIDAIQSPDEPDILDRIAITLEFHIRVGRTRTY